MKVIKVKTVEGLKCKLKKAAFGTRTFAVILFLMVVRITLNRGGIYRLCHNENKLIENRICLVNCHKLGKYMRNYIQAW